MRGEEKKILPSFWLPRMGVLLRLLWARPKQERDPASDLDNPDLWRERADVPNKGAWDILGRFLEHQKAGSYRRHGELQNIPGKTCTE